MKFPRVLAVDDDPALLQLLTLTLEDHGFEVLPASNGVQALQLARSDSVDAVVLDLQMPGMDGREFYRRFRAVHGGTPVLILSAYGARDAAAELGAAASLQKPYREQDLIRTVARLTGSVGAAAVAGD